MKVNSQPISKHFSWVPVSFLTFIYNRDLLCNVKSGAINREGLLGLLRAFYSSNWQTIKKFRETACPIPVPEIMVTHILNVVADQPDSTFYGDVYWALKEYNKPDEDRDARRALITDQLVADVPGNAVLEALKDHNRIRAAVDVIDEMFYRDGTYPRPEKKKQNKTNQRKTA